jgi:hypothetical protein
MTGELQFSNRMITALGYPHVLSIINRIAEFHSHSPIRRCSLGHAPDLLALLAQSPVLGDCG